VEDTAQAAGGAGGIGVDIGDHYSPSGVPREAEACPGRGRGVYGWLQQLRARRRGPWRHEVAWEVVEAEGVADAEVELGHRLKMREPAHDQLIKVEPSSTF
jgi:hypothetical protein